MTLPEQGREVDVWTNASTYTQREGIRFESEPSWVTCFVRSKEDAFDRVICVERESGISFALVETGRWRYADE